MISEKRDLESGSCFTLLNIAKYELRDEIDHLEQFVAPVNLSEQPQLQSAIRKNMAPLVVFWVHRHADPNVAVFVWESDGK